ncbi:hypothetical protein Ssi02_44720 [Sinosporangium siamense]|uniref:Uncharacterized protein n=1 Tax=Sinosporangium siamense TaxID=1367973 RepID=A0A919RLD3_9ACTN|nr:hypothetical protein Ssi02_44720 [Sinosporangium siamense]
MALDAAQLEKQNLIDRALPLDGSHIAAFRAGEKCEPAVGRPRHDVHPSDELGRLVDEQTHPGGPM